MSVIRSMAAKLSVKTDRKCDKASTKVRYVFRNLCVKMKAYLADNNVECDKLITFLIVI